MSSSEEVLEAETSGVANILRSPSASRFHVDKVDKERVQIETQLTISTTLDTLVGCLNEMNHHITILYSLGQSNTYTNTDTKYVTYKYE
jgi:hypothetical protein